MDPEILSWDSHTLGREGRLSVPDYMRNVTRPERIKLLADGVEHEYDMEDFDARAVQRGLNHYDDMVFLDCVVSRYTEVLRHRQYR